MEKEGELNVLRDILARDLETMEADDDDDDESIDSIGNEVPSSSQLSTKSSGKRSSFVDRGEKLRSLAEERQRLERDNREKKRRLEELRRQELLIEEAAIKGEYVDTRIADIHSVAMSPQHKSNKSDAESGSDLMSSYETLSEESGSSDSDDEDQQSAVSEVHGNEKHKSTEVVKKHRVKISPVRWKTGESSSKTSRSKFESAPLRSRDSRRISPDNHRHRPSSSSRLSNRMDKLYKYIFLDAKFFLMKSSNHENVALAQAKGVWSTPPQNEARLNQAFQTSSNVILIFSVKESGKFQGFARISAESDRNHPPVRWVLPPGLSARTLSSVFTLDWINRNDLDFMHTGRLHNAWNENQPIRIGRDGQAIEPVAGEALCRLFAIDCKVDLHAIALKSREAMDRRKLDPHELYREHEALRRKAKLTEHQVKVQRLEEAKRRHHRSKPDDIRHLERLQDIVQKVQSTIGVYNDFQRGYEHRATPSSRRLVNGLGRQDPYQIDRSSYRRGNREEQSQRAHLRERELATESRRHSDRRLDRRPDSLLLYNRRR